MANITENGRRLATKLNPAIGTTREILETCSLIARHAKTLHHIAVAECNGPHWMSTPLASRLPQAEYSRLLGEWETYIAKRDEQVKARLRALVDSLPRTEEGPIAARLGGDPRGCVVKLALPGDYAKLHDDFGREGICVEAGR